MASEMIRRSTVGNEIASQVRMMIDVHEESMQRAQNESLSMEIRKDAMRSAEIRRYAARQLLHLARRIGAATVVEKEFEASHWDTSY